MKRIMMYLSILLLIAAFPSINCIAQRSEINRIAEELEKNGGDVTNLVKRNSKKELYYKSKSIRFISKNSTYAERLQKAFEKAGEEANSSSSNLRPNIDRKYWSLVFLEGNMKYTYILTIRNLGVDPRVDLDIEERNLSVDDEIDVIMLGSGLEDGWSPSKNITDDWQDLLNIGKK